MLIDFNRTYCHPHHCCCKLGCRHVIDAPWLWRTSLLNYLEAQFCHILCLLESDWNIIISYLQWWFHDLCFRQSLSPYLTYLCLIWWTLLSLSSLLLKSEDSICIPNTDPTIHIKSWGKIFVSMREKNSFTGKSYYWGSNLLYWISRSAIRLGGNSYNRMINIRNFLLFLSFNISIFKR